MEPLILLPGALGSMNQFDDLGRYLGELNITCHAMNLAGHGLDPYSSEAQTVPFMAEAMMNQLNLKKIVGPVNILGHSLGGYLGVYMCLKYPDRINKVFTLGTKWHWTSDIAAQEINLLNPENMVLKIPAFAAKLLKDHGTNWEYLVQAMATLIRDLGNHNYLAPEKITPVEQGVRIGLGDRDNMVTFEESFNTFIALKHSEFQVFPNTPHPFNKFNLLELGLSVRNFFTLSPPD